MNAPVQSSAAQILYRISRDLHKVFYLHYLKTLIYNNAEGLIEEKSRIERFHTITVAQMDLLFKHDDRLFRNIVSRSKGLREYRTETADMQKLTQYLKSKTPRFHLRLMELEDEIDALSVVLQTQLTLIEKNNSLDGETLNLLHAERAQLSKIGMTAYKSQRLKVKNWSQEAGERLAPQGLETSKRTSRDGQRLPKQQPAKHKEVGENNWIVRAWRGLTGSKKKSS